MPQKPEQLGITAPSGGFQQGGWYSGRQYWGGTLSEPGQIHPSSNQKGAGEAVSEETMRQTSPDNVSYIEQQRKVSAEEIKAPVNIPLPQQTNSGLNAELESARKALEQNLGQRQEETQAKLEKARAREQDIVKKAEPLTEPFREETEAEMREQYGTEGVLADQKALLGELDQLLTEGNELIRQQQEVTGLAAIRNPRVQKTMEDVSARAGVINAVVNLQNTYLSNAYQSIDRTINNINADRQDRLNYYNTLLSLANRDIVELTKESRNIAQQQTNLLGAELENAQATVNKIKTLMLDPASAQLMAQSGVKLNDSVETINAKMGQAQYENEIKELSNKITIEGGTPVVDPSTVSADQLVSFTDTRGQVHYYKIPETTGVAGEATADDYLSTLSGVSETKETTTKTEKTVTFPQFTPAEPNYIWVDPKTGIMWQYIQGEGWRQIG